MRSTSDSRLRRAAALLALLLVAAIVPLAACGGDDETAPTVDATTELPTGTLSKAELADQADSLCTDATERILDEAEPPSFSPEGPTQEEIEASVPFWEATAAEGEVLIDQLSQLEPQPSEQRRWDRYLDLLEDGTVDYANALLGPAQDGDPETFFDTAVDEQRELAKLARASAELGLEVCGARDAPATS
jgi:hypothetical protein